MLSNEHQDSDLVTIECQDDEEIVWSRNELASFSDYFKVLLFGNFQEKLMRKIHLRDIDGKYLKILLNFYKELKERSEYQALSNIKQLDGH